MEELESELKDKDDDYYQPDYGDFTNENNQLGLVSFIQTNNQVMFKVLKIEDKNKITYQS